jgi:hypothetical protein
MDDINTTESPPHRRNDLFVPIVQIGKLTENPPSALLG